MIYIPQNSEKSPNIKNLILFQKFYFCLVDLGIDVSLYSERTYGDRVVGRVVGGR